MGGQVILPQQHYVHFTWFPKVEAAFVLHYGYEIKDSDGYNDIWN